MGLSTTSVVEEEIYYTEEYKTLIRSHKEFLIQSTPPSVEVVTSLLYAFRYDFYGYLKYKGVPPKLWWTCAFLSDIKKPYQDISRLSKWYYPDITHIEQIISRSNTIRA